MRINNNLDAFNAYRQLTSNMSNTAKSLEKLSSGLRVNRAGDDAAGLSISEKMRSQIRGLSQASKNAQNGISLIQTAEGALNETHSILQRMKELAVQAANGSNTDADRSYLQKEVNQLAMEVTKISKTTEFNTKTLLSGGMASKATFDKTQADFVDRVNVAPGTPPKTGTYEIKVTDVVVGDSDDYEVEYEVTGNIDGENISVKNTTFQIEFNQQVEKGDSFIIDVDSSQASIFHIGANEQQNTSLAINDMGGDAIGLNKIDLSTRESADEAIKTIESALNKVSSQRAALGAMQNRLEHTINNLGTSFENLSAAESRIRDIDMAKEMMMFTRNDILTQASQAMLAQANMQPERALQLLGPGSED